MTDDQEVLRAAHRIVRDPAWKHVLTEIKATAFQEFESAQQGDDNARRTAWHMLDSVARIDNVMQTLAGKVDKTL